MGGRACHTGEGGLVGRQCVAISVLLQVTGMLPGGLSIVGVFICCQVLSPQLLARLAKVLMNIDAGQEFKGHQPHQHLSLLHYCPVKKK